MRNRRGHWTVKRSAAAKLLSKFVGFRKIGSFHVGTCSQDVISGYALDAPPGGLHVWRFVLPTYDRIEFLHLSLGTRIAGFPPGEQGDEPSNVEALYALLQRDWHGLSKVRDAKCLLDYVEREHGLGEYAQWAKYLTCIRVGRFDTANCMEQGWRDSGGFLKIESLAESFKAVLNETERKGWSGAQMLLAEWSKTTAAKFCK